MTADPAGWLHLRLRLSWPDEVPRPLVGVGPELEVLEPAPCEIGSRRSPALSPTATRPIDSAVPVGGGESGPTTRGRASRDT